MTKSKQKTKLLLDEAARRGYLRIFTDHATGESKKLWDADTCTIAAENGQLDVLKFLRSQDPPCPWSEGTCTGAARKGHLDVLKWLRSQDPPCPWSTWTCYYAAVYGHLKVLKWLIDNGCPYDVRLGCKSAYEKLGLAQERNAQPSQPSTPLRPAPAPAALPPPAHAPTPAALDRAPAPAASGTPGSVVIEQKIFRYNEWNFMGYLKKHSGIITEDWLFTALSMTKSKPKLKCLFDEAARRGYLRIFTDHATGESKRLWDAEMLLAAVGGGDLDLLKFLRSKDPPCPWHE